MRSWCWSFLKIWKVYRITIYKTLVWILMDNIFIEGRTRERKLYSVFHYLYSHFFIFMQIWEAARGCIHICFYSEGTRYDSSFWHLSIRFSVFHMQVIKIINNPLAFWTLKALSVILTWHLYLFFWFLTLNTQLHYDIFTIHIQAV